MDASYMEVRFDLYCGKCKHSALSGTEEPCNTCIGRPVMFGTEKPKNFSERVTRTKNKRYSAKTISKKGGKGNG